MQYELLDLICCPACHRKLEVTESKHNEPEVWADHLTCVHIWTSGELFLLARKKL